MQRPLSVIERPRKTDNLIKTGTAQGGFYKPKTVQRCASSRALRPKLFETAGHTSHTPQKARDENASCSKGGGSAGLGAPAPALRICHQHPVAHTVPWEVWGVAGHSSQGPSGAEQMRRGAGRRLQPRD